MSRPHRVVIVVYDGVQALDVTGPHEVFAGANAVLARSAPPYAIAVAATAPDRTIR